MAASNGVLKVGVPSLVLPMESAQVSWVLHTICGFDWSSVFSLLPRDAEELVGDVVFLLFLSIDMAIIYNFCDRNKI